MRYQKTIYTLLIIVLGFLYYSYTGNLDLEAVTVIEVIDGDTVKLEHDIKVRLVGINTREKNNPYSDEAKELLESLVLEEGVYLERTGVDRYGRVLGYLFTENGENINEVIVRRGLAHIYYYEKDLYYDSFKASEGFARDAGLGIWSVSTYRDCVSLIELDYYDKGDDHETLVLENECSESIDVVIKDDATHVFRETLEPGLFTRTFKNTFNDNGDSLYVWDKEGSLIVFYRYA